MSRELLQDAAWALKDLIAVYPETACIETRISAQKVIAALEQELAKPEQEPNKEWVGLHEFELTGMTCECVDDGTFNMKCAIDFGRAIEAKLKDKNTTNQ